MPCGTGGLAPAPPPIQRQSPSNNWVHSGHGDTTGWRRQITHLEICLSSYKLQVKVTAWVRGLVGIYRSPENTQCQIMIEDTPINLSPTGGNVLEMGRRSLIKV